MHNKSNWKSRVIRFHSISVIVCDYFCYYPIKMEINGTILVINLDNRKQA